MKARLDIVEFLKGELNNHETTIVEYENQLNKKLGIIKWAREPKLYLELFIIERNEYYVGEAFDEGNDKVSIKLAYDSLNRIIKEERADRYSSKGYKKFIYYHNETIWANKFIGAQIDRIKYQI